MLRRLQQIKAEIPEMFGRSDHCRWHCIAGAQVSEDQAFISLFPGGQNFPSLQGAQALHVPCEGVTPKSIQSFSRGQVNLKSAFIHHNHSNDVTWALAAVTDAPSCHMPALMAFGRRVEHPSVSIESAQQGQDSPHVEHLSGKDLEIHQVHGGAAMLRGGPEPTS